MLGAIGGCAEERDERRFANDPVATNELPTAAAPATPAVRPSPTRPASPVAWTDLLRARGAPSRFYFRSGRELWTLAGDESPRRVLAPPTGSELRAVAASPNGDRVAVLLAERNQADERTTLLVLDAAGRELQRVDRLEGVLDQAPDRPSGDEPRARSLDWAPQGGQLLVAFAPGGLVAVPTVGSGEPTLVVGPDRASAPAEAAWAPTGEAVAFLDPVGGGSPANLFLAKTAPSPSPPEPLLATIPAGRTIAELAWLPNGTAILYAEAAAPGGPATAGDLWRVPVVGGPAAVVASAGSAAPVGEIKHVAPSSDGRAVAYTVTVPDADGPRFHSLWVQELGQGRRLLIEIPPGRAVTDLWWTTAGLVARTVATPFDTGYDGGNFSLLLAATTAGPLELLAGPSSLPATPTRTGASGVATPRPDDRPDPNGGTPIATRAE